MRTLPVILLTAAVGCAHAAAQETEASARQLTVEMFATRPISSVTIAPLGQSETMRLCEACRPQALKKPLRVVVRGDQVETSAGARGEEIHLAGAFRITPDADAETVDAAGEWKLTVVRGALRVLLTMDSERYVARALEGEAEAQEPLESMKAMAIAVRTFALKNVDRHRSAGFNLCDSTHCQALKFATPSALVEQAVRETAGATLWYGGRRALVFYTQNCGGETESARQAWPGTVAPYLRAHGDPYCTRRGTAEWHAEVALADLERVAQKEGWNLPQRIDSVRVVKRTDAGRVLRLEFSGGGRNDPVSASSLRFALDRVLGWNQLRSEWYSVELRGGVLHFDGRGYGHGVGLCQAGATEMAKEGHAAGEILDFYFPGTRIGVTGQDRGWSEAHERGWTLWTTIPSAGLVKAGNEAWEHARALYAPRGTVLPEVWEMPTTELFRQETSEPGWMLASTEGQRVFLQPEEILNRPGREESTLLHEFLHVLVESDAAAQAPLWLREGVVEALAEEGSPVRGVEDRIDRVKLDAALARPTSQQQSQRAHAQAAELAGALIARYGLEPVRQWLRAGRVPEAALMTPGPARGSAAAREQAPSRQP